MQAEAGQEDTYSTQRKTTTDEHKQADPVHKCATEHYAGQCS
ncbi:hypothetical protein SAMN05216178_6590 [Pseudomonas saponiphila]|uniref:Uncharacterized protein n=1 Tax=Pseudomonas saponiphila TaxID=556534 RepID=A0A1H4ZD71_9PSED|nr:hypothetical protein SAMN05216178_6590 [Pseudomonas saponiphila]